MGKLSAVVDGLKPAMMMVAVQAALTGVNIFYKIAGHNGASLPVFVSYRFLFAAAFIVPVALFLERKNRPKITLKIGLLAFLSALFGGSLAQNLYAKSLVLTSATFIAAMCNLIPAMTLILAVICRMEALGLKTMAGKAKLIGIILGIGGAMILTFYKGFEINIFSTHFDLLHRSQPSHGHVAAAHHDNSIPGLFTSLACGFSAALGLIFQAKMSHAFPFPYSSTALISIMGSLQAVVYALCVERDWSQWKLGWNLQLLGYAYTGVIGSGIMWVFVMATVRMRGPLFVSVFSPLLLVLVAIAGSLLLKEKLHLGSVLGGVIIVCGLYLVLWAKSKEMKKLARLVPSKCITNAIVEGNTSDSFKVFNHGSNVVVVTPNCVSESGLIAMCDDEEEKVEEDLEAIVSITKSKP